MRIRKKPWAQGELDSNPCVIHAPEVYRGKWHTFFKNDNPIHIEIGCGKGGFLIGNAALHPDINFIGIERQSSVIAIAARKMDRQLCRENSPCDENKPFSQNSMLNNVALVCMSAQNLHNVFAPTEVSRVYLNFSDPWPKKRWAKRRLTHRGFLESYRQLMGDAGEVFLKTDNRSLFEFSLNEFSAQHWSLSQISLDLHHSAYEGNIMTEYEEKFSGQGMPIYRLEARFEKKILP